MLTCWQSSKEVMVQICHILSYFYAYTYFLFPEHHLFFLQYSAQATSHPGSLPWHPCLPPTWKCLSFFSPNIHIILHYSTYHIIINGLHVCFPPRSLNLLRDEMLLFLFSFSTSSTMPDIFLVNNWLMELTDKISGIQEELSNIINNLTNK